MAHADEGSPVPIAGSGPDAGRRPRRVRPAWATALTYLAMLGLCGFIAQRAPALWSEWAKFRVDRVSLQASELVGYIDIAPNPSRAEPPAEWFGHEGGQARLWSGWDGRDHRWFRFDDLGAIDPRRLSMPIGRDVIRAVDRPIHEEPGGDIWARIPDDAPVAVVAIDGRSSLYPLKVLEKVGAVNDRLGERTFLVAYTPVEGRVVTYERSISGREVVLAHSGYFLKHDLIFYDRETESLWVAQGGAMTAVAGSRRGDRLPALGPVPMRSWADCRQEHPKGRLLVGARRSYDQASR